MCRLCVCVIKRKRKKEKNSFFSLFKKQQLFMCLDLVTSMFRPTLCSSCDASVDHGHYNVAAWTVFIQVISQRRRCWVVRRCWHGELACGAGDESAN